uniref:Uncharacterized protein n=1 Tax=Timema douglasi TaxID=61478 RepID=A0A7R8ZHU6_TIMDO|nr:unnamed protein product [Timema douglasi]
MVQRKTYNMGENNKSDKDNRISTMKSDIKKNNDPLQPHATPLQHEKGISEKLRRELVLLQPVLQGDNINLNAKELTWALQAAMRRAIPVMKEVMRCIAAGKIRLPAVISTLKKPEGGITTCWKESAQLLMDVLLPDDNPEERDEENEKDRQNMKMAYKNENVIVEPVTQDKIKRLKAGMRRKKAPGPDGIRWYDILGLGLEPGLLEIEALPEVVGMVAFADDLLIVVEARLRRNLK